MSAGVEMQLPEFKPFLHAPGVGGSAGHSEKQAPRQGPEHAGGVRARRGTKRAA